MSADPGGFPDFRMLFFSESVDFWNVPVGVGVWEGLQSIGNGCGLQMNGFSGLLEPHGSILFMSISNHTDPFCTTSMMSVV